MDPPSPGTLRARRAAGGGRGHHPCGGRAGGRQLSRGTATTLRGARSGPGLHARRLALLALFEEEFRPEQAAAALERLADEKGSNAEVRSQARAIVAGVLERRNELDEMIGRYAPAIPVDELGRVERAILRSAIWEVLYSAATPSGEAIRDAVSLARIYAGDAARRLVNGVLGSVSRSSGGGA